MNIESLNRRIRGRLSDGHSLANELYSFFIIHTCSLAGLVIEVDGDIHDLQKEEDERRERVLSALGLRVVRFGNDEIVMDVSAAVGKIKTFILHHSEFILALRE